MVHLYNGILYSRKKEGSPTLGESMGETGEYDASEISQAAQIPYDLTYKWNLINKRNETTVIV